MKAVKNYAAVLASLLMMMVAGETVMAACPPIISRAQWGARAPTNTSPLSRPVPKVFIHHSEGPTCTTEARCKEIIRGIQNYHMNTRGWADIGYNFIIGEDGNIYEGRGWTHLGAHALGWNPKSIGIVFLGSFQSRIPNSKALDAAKQLIACGQPDKISKSYTLHGHRDGVCTTCPGNALYNHIKTWPKFGGGLKPKYGC